MNKSLSFERTEYLGGRDSDARRTGVFSNWIELIEHRASEQGENTALMFPLNGNVLRISYGELCRRSRIVGSLLQARGAKNERVLLACRSGPEFLAGFFGCLYAGATVGTRVVLSQEVRSRYPLHHIEANGRLQLWKRSVQMHSPVLV